MKKQLAIIILVCSVSFGVFAAPVNTTCPVGARPIRTDITSIYQGKTVAFCCLKCKAKFDAAPSKFAANIK